MKKMILAAFAAFTLVAGVAQVASAQTVHSQSYYDSARNAAGNTGWGAGG